MAKYNETQNDFPKVHRDQLITVQDLIDFDAFGNQRENTSQSMAQSAVSKPYFQDKGQSANSYKASKINPQKS